MAEAKVNATKTILSQTIRYTKSELKCGKITNYKFGNAEANNGKEMLKNFLIGLTLTAGERI